MQRRDFLLATGGAFALGYAGARACGLNDTSSNGDSEVLRLQPARYDLQAEGPPTEHLVSASADSPPPVLVAKQNQPVTFTVHNGLKDEYTAMHWHGIRLANAMDGVPYLTQLPIGYDDAFDYSFTPPDAGTYWYHPHCMTMTQMARGMTGVLIIKEPTDPGFSAEQVLNLRDFLIDADGVLQTPYSLRNAARAGTHGNLITCNWQPAPHYTHPSGSLVRLRIANTDTTRVYPLYLSSQAGKVIAWDGHPVEVAIPMPTEKSPLQLGPGQRVDIALRMPENESDQIEVKAAIAGQDALLASLQSIGASEKRQLAELGPLPRNPLSEPQLKQAKKLDFIIGWSPDGRVPDNGFCGSLGRNFWSINRVAWAGDGVESTAALASLELGKSYILRFRNASPNLHPVHLHGLVFKPIRSNLRAIAANWTDTVLLLKNETIDVVLVADNPGKWALHCHVIEHQKTGLAGFIHVI